MRAEKHLIGHISTRYGEFQYRKIYNFTNHITNYHIVWVRPGAEDICIYLGPTPHIASQHWLKITGYEHELVEATVAEEREVQRQIKVAENQHLQSNPNFGRF